MMNRKLSYNLRGKKKAQNPSSQKIPLLQISQEPSASTVSTRTEEMVLLQIIIYIKHTCVHIACIIVVLK